jgi:hypothetical protein
MPVFRLAYGSRQGLDLIFDENILLVNGRFESCKFFIIGFFISFQRL